ncbi:flavoprotein [Penicillium argentinense]|uniref:Flavoprotein n=1 Tax=Penicillium argentinense TaxID=1131581 RepID=A0A9W9FE08_9EURO|nr:flavoprotein [Penicillium argentinense]KAJ5098344.1 flavoprotein [Penicillium argentinense]
MAHHPQWSRRGYYRTGVEAEDLIGLMGDHGLELLTPRGTTTCEKHERGAVRKTTIDLAWALSTLANRLIRCEAQRQSLHAADHVPVLTEVNIETQQRPRHKRLQWKNADWKAWLAALTPRSQTWKVGPYETTEQIDAAVELMVTDILQAAQDNVPRTGVNEWSIPGYTQQLAPLRAEVRRARRRAKAEDSDALEFRQLRHKLGRQSAKIARTAHRERVEEATQVIQEFWNLAKWAPWTGKDSIVQSSLIRQYLEGSAAQEGIDRKMRFCHKVNKMDWASSSNMWTFDITANDTEKISLGSRFVFLGTGYYDCQEPLRANVPGIDSFQGEVIHLQFWPVDLDYTNKRVVIIGSGATAITLLPSLTAGAAHVTMLQRSPTYIASLPRQGGFESIVSEVLPRFAANVLTRISCLHTIHGSSACVFVPMATSMPLLGAEKKSIKTGAIEKITTSSIELASGEELHPDIIVTATGLKICSSGGITITIDSEPYDISDHFAWRTAMVEALPNAALSWVYADASWTLGADSTVQLVCRLLTRMRKQGVSVIVPRIMVEERKVLEERPFLGLTATYVKKGGNPFPKPASTGP